MPIFWKYLLKNHIQYFILCVFTFVSILLVIRFEEIALFAASGAFFKDIALFSLYQIPYILPIAIPISSLISSFVLFRKMSLSSELTALRASSLSLSTIIFPIMISGWILTIINFTITSEVTPACRMQVRNLFCKIALENPFVVLQPESSVRLKSFSFDLKKLEIGKKAEEVICITKQSSTERLGILTAKELSVDSSWIHGKSISIVSSPNSGYEGPDHLIIENQGNMQINKPSIGVHLINSEWFEKEDLYGLKHLINNPNPRALKEIYRRIYLGFCPITFTLIGIAFGIQIQRKARKYGILWAFSLAGLLLVCFLAARPLQQTAIKSFIYLFPHPIAIVLSLRSLRLTYLGSL